MDRKKSLHSFLEKSAQVSAQQELLNSSKLLSSTFVKFQTPLLVSTTYRDEGHKNIATKVYAYAISCDGSYYYLYRESYQASGNVRAKFTASVKETLGFMRQSLSETSKKESEVTSGQSKKPATVDMG
jgi:hypothetical protein